MADARENKTSRKRKLSTPNKDEKKAKSPKKNNRYKRIMSFGKCQGNKAYQNKQAHNEAEA